MKVSKARIAAIYLDPFYPTQTTSKELTQAFKQGDVDLMALLVALVNKVKDLKADIAKLERDIEQLTPDGW